MSNQAAVGGGEIYFVALLGLVWRRKLVLIGALIFGFIAFTVIVNSIPPRYASSAVLLLGKQEASAAGGKPNLQSVAEAMEIMRSRMMGYQVVSRMNLMADPEFNLSLPQVEGGKESFKTLTLEGKIDSSVSEYAPMIIEETVSRFLESLTVREMAGASALRVGFSSRDPVKAARVANAVADIFIHIRNEESIESRKQHSVYIDQKLSQLRGEMQDLGQQVEAYRKEHMLVQGMTGMTPAEQAENLEKQLIIVQADIADLEARLSYMQSLKIVDLNPNALPEMVRSDDIERLKGELSRARQIMADLSGRYGEKHPRMVQARAELDHLESMVDAEVRKVALDLQDQIDLAQGQANNLQEQIHGLLDQSYSSHEVLEGLYSLEEQLDIKEQAYDKLLSDYTYIPNVQPDGGSQARVISRAIPNFMPVSPDRFLIVGLGSFLSFCMGLVFIVLMEKFDRTFHSATEIEDVTDEPCYALIPSAGKDLRGEVSAHVLKYPSSIITESVRTLRTVLNLRAGTSAAGQRPKIVSMTSSYSGEGKTVLCSWLGRSAAQAGEKVIVIDCDLRRPNLDKTLGVQAGAGLVEYLTGQASIEDIVQKDEQSGLYVIYARAVPNSALHLLGSEKMRLLIEALREAYDLVLLDSPPCLAVSDARVLSTLADLTLYGVEWGKTQQQHVMQGVKQFKDINANLAMVLMNVDVRRYVLYGYGDVVYYYAQN
jgi:capsular exopolysaccharide synthesis family protein